MNRMFAVLLLLFCVACSGSRKPDIAGLSYTCGSQDATNAAAVVLIQTPSGENLSAADIRELRAQFRSAEGVQPLVPTLHGCLLLPRATGVVEVQSPGAAWALARPVTVEGTARFARWNLDPGGIYQFKLLCPSEGLFTSPRLALPILGQVDGASELFHLQLVLRDAADRGHVIYEKKLGQALVQLPDSIDLLNLAEGSYTLDVRLRDLSRDWDASDASRLQSCPLTLVRSVPGLSGTSLVSSLGLEIYRRGDILPLTVSDPRSRLYVCREKASAEESCEAAAACQDPENFTLSSTVPLNDAGTYRYFLQAENIVKVRSRPICHKIFVSASAPVLAARWKSPVIDEENAVLREPRSILGMTIAMQHPVIPDAQLEDALQCRAEFLIGGLLTRKGADIVCMSGRCQGRSLETWQPCDRDLSVSIASALQIPNLLNSQLRLSVRTSDGAGQTQELTKSVWLQKSRWNMTTVSSGDVFESALTRDGAVIQVNNRAQTLQFKDGQTQEIPAPFAEVVGVTLAQLEDGNVIAAFRVNGKSRFALYENGNWQPLPIKGWLDDFAPCSRIFPDGEDAFLCSAQGSLTRMRRDQVLQRVTGAPTCLGLFSDSVARLGTEDYVVNCRRSLHRYDARTDRWQAYHLPSLFPNADIFPPQIAEGALERDGLGRVWILAVAGFENEVAAAFIDADGLHPVPAPVPTKPDFSALSLARNSRGQMQVMDRVWDESQRSWQVLPSIRDAFPAGVTIRVRRFADGGLLYESEHLLLHEARDGVLALFPWKGLDLPTRSAIENVQRHAQGVFILGAFNSIRRLYQFQLRAWASFGGPFLNLDDNILIPFPMQDKMRVRSPGQGSFVLDEGSWTMDCKESPGRFTTPFATRQDLYLGAYEGLYRCDPETQTWESVLEFDDWNDANDWLMPTAASVVEDRWGRVWFGKLNGRLVYREGDRYQFADSHGSVNGLMLIQGHAATAGYSQMTVWNEDMRRFEVTPFADLGIDEASFGSVKSTAQGLLIYAPDPDHFRILDRNHNTERTERAMSGCQHFLSTQGGTLICLTWDSIYQQIPGRDWVLVAGPFAELDLKRAILERDRYLWVPVKHDIVRIDLPEASQ